MNPLDKVADVIIDGAEVVDTVAKVAFVGGGAWLVASVVFQVLGTLIFGDSES